MQFLNKLQTLALIALRIAAGAIFFSHGWVKLTHASASMKMFGGMGFPPWTGLAIGAIETAGGLFLVLGLFTRISALILFIEMCVAIGFVHWRHAPWWDVKSYELALACFGISLALAAFGPGPASLDHALFRNQA